MLDALSVRIFVIRLRPAFQHTASPESKQLPPWNAMDSSDEPGVRAYADQRMHNHKQYNIQRGFSCTAILNALDGSLEHPKASHMDLLQTHCYNRHTRTRDDEGIARSRPFKWVNFHSLIDVTNFTIL
ncbi:hypothetical protein PM082_011065 [Marasmius tenuissimus]|nr:hypothetical protein PM082_011065 [Marasmius tenuissimus]